MNLAKTIDHTILKPDCKVDDIKKLCEEATTFEFSSVCVPPYFVKAAAQILEESSVKVATVVGFPFGYATTSAKVEEIKRAINDGADEVDVVVNICAVKDGKWSYVKSDIDSVTSSAHIRGKTIKVIFETDLLSKEEILKLCNICSDLRVNFVKTSTGVNGTAATEEVVSFLRKNLPDYVKIKASGGIRTTAQAMGLIDSGAARIGTSAGVSIMQED